MYVRGVEDPADDVVGGLTGGEGLVSAFVSEDPDACANQSGGKGIHAPCDEPSDAVERRMRQLYVGLVDFGDVSCGRVEEQS